MDKLDEQLKRIRTFIILMKEIIYIVILYTYKSRWRPSQRLNFTSNFKHSPVAPTISPVISPTTGQHCPNGDISLTSGQGYLVPNSLYLRYRATILKPTENGTMLGTPYLTPFSRLEVIIGNNVVRRFKTTIRSVIWSPTVS
jgi:hypothetical protein